MEPTTPARTLTDLAAAAGDLLLAVDGGSAVTGVSFDSRLLRRGDLFFCIPGSALDGHAFAPDAAVAGASALCVERRLDVDLPQILVADTRRAMARIAAEFFGHPAEQLLMIGVTGTNGKTTTAYLIESILHAAGHRPGLIGTIETHVGPEIVAGVRTTPESLDLQRLLALMIDRGCNAVAMEVTSHALSLQRVEGIRYDSAVFTNLSQDHLDFHSSMDDYFEAKRSLFDSGRLEAGAVNIDDPYGRRLYDRATVPTLGYGMESRTDVFATSVDMGSHSSELVVATPAGECKITTHLPGRFNVYNCLAAAAACLNAEIPLAAIEDGINRLGVVPGRFESVDQGQPFAVIVDYAHSPDSLDNVLRAARDLAGGGKVLAVFGCGGDRDRGKRPLMGAVAARLADVVIVTSDNPRSEEPEAIISEIVEGVVAQRVGGPDAVLEDRRAAIEHAVRTAGSGDVVVVAGKGHEPGQQFADRTIPFDDRAVARDALRAAGYGPRETL